VSAESELVDLFGTGGADVAGTVQAPAPDIS
jgi:hypothetical protein